MTTVGLGESECVELARWADGMVDRDGKFIREFQTTFNSSFWEIYIYACHKELGWIVDSSHSSPDFVATTTDTGIVVSEATIANNPSGYRPEWESDLTPEMLKQVEIKDVLYLATIRLANALHSKHKKYVDQYAKLEHVRGRPFVLWIAPFEQPFFYLQNTQALERVLFGYDKPLIIRNAKGKKPTVIGESYYPQIDKDSGRTLDLGFFTDIRVKEISAVIFSNTATFCKLRALSEGNKPMAIFQAIRYNEYSSEPKLVCATKTNYSETLLDGLHVFMNPFADHPLSSDLFEKREIAIHMANPVTRSIHSIIPHCFLIQRMCMTISTVDSTAPIPPRSNKSIKYRRPTPPAWPEGQLRKVEGFSGPFICNYMSHYRGWTIIVAMCSIDCDWGCQAVLGTFRSIGEFFDANQRDEMPYILAEEWYPSKEEALAEIQKRIDAIEQEDEF